MKTRNAVTTCEWMPLTGDLSVLLCVQITNRSYLFPCLAPKTLNQVSWRKKKKKKKGKVIGGIKVQFMNVIRACLTRRDRSETSQTGVSVDLLVLKVFAAD